MELKDISGIGKVRLSKFQSNGINSVADLLNYYPYKYYDFTASSVYNKQNKQFITIKAKVVGPAKAVFFGGKSYAICKMEDTDCNMFNAIWYNQPFMKNNLTEGVVYFLYGAVNNKNQFVVNKSFRADNTETNIVPVYKPLDGVSSGTIRNCINEVLKSAECVKSLLPQNIEENNKFMPLLQAYNNIHNCKTTDIIEEAKERVGFENLLIFAGLEESLKKDKIQKMFNYRPIDTAEFEKVSGISLTSSQLKAIKDCYADMDSKISMNRLILGDVGSGKTMVAFACAYKATQSNGQAVLLCPTEILASQHFANAFKIWKAGEVKLLIGSTRNAEKNTIKEELKTGKIKFLISTHACLNDNVEFNNLMLVITDEQHRFGVAQRAKLSKKRDCADTILLSATPIPRSLSLVLFGGLNVSELAERPNGESKIQTNIVPNSKLKDMWRFIAERVNNENGKVFVIVPRINKGAENEDRALLSVADAEEEIKSLNLFDKDSIGVVHGKMTQNEKENVMASFKSGKIRILISTTVVEVGVDVKDANIMVIYNADNFGLATLHQLRGRVGRDGREGYCFCVVGAVSDVTARRLKVFKMNNNGLKIAEEDLKLRGAGTMYGTNQHGFNELYSVVNFSVEGYKVAQKIFSELPKIEQQNIISIAESKFGEIYKQIVFNWLVLKNYFTKY